VLAESVASPYARLVDSPLATDSFALLFSMKRSIATAAAPKAVGPYSQAVAFGNLLFCAGQIPLHPETGELVGADVAAQTEQVCQNIRQVLAANEMTIGDVVKTTVYLLTMDDFAAMNAVYARHFPEPYPARSTVAVAGLPRGARVEIEVTAAKA
jgi:2-iminobutanoate/2-iminopropanoate deaminase